MSKGNTFENDILKAIFNATAIANLLDNAGTSPLTNLYLALHTADPGEAGSQTTSECTYSPYARVAVARTSGGFTVSGNSVVLAALASFAAASGNAPGTVETATHFSVGTASSGAGKILYSGPLGPTGGSCKQGACTGKASNDTVSAPGSSLVVNDQVSFQPVDGFSLPGGITAGVCYFVKTVSGTDVTLSTTQGGSTLDVTSDGAGYLFKHQNITIANGVTPQLGTGTTITED